MKWQSVVTGEMPRSIVASAARGASAVDVGRRPGSGGSVPRLPAHVCLALIMLGAPMGRRK